VTGIIK